jgi:nucleotide sugar dehydrogenase
MVNIMGDAKILVLGLGQIGYHDAQYISSLGLTVDGYDISEKAVKRALGDGVIAHAAKDFSGYDEYIVAISTHNPSDMFQPYLDGLTELCERLGSEAKRSSLIAIESTIPPGYSEEIMSLVKHRLHVAHIPHRFFMEDKEKHGVRQLRVLGGCESCCANAALTFYKDVLNIPVYPVQSIVYAELSKVIENTHRFLEIAFAEELRIFCDLYGLSFIELREAVNSKWNENVLEARGGIGGHCLPKDSQMYLRLANQVLGESLIATAKQVDKSYLKHTANSRERPKLRDLVSSPSRQESKREETKHLILTR